jgi:putative endonuclease
MYYVYILYSVEFDKYYIGQTNDVKSRLNRHNNGEVNYTKSYKPWSLILVIEKPTRSESMALEKKIKNLNRERLKAFIEKYT